MGTVVKDGWLSKSSAGKQGLNHKLTKENWQRRYFVLRAGQQPKLVYYKDENAFRTKGAPSGQLMLMVALKLAEPVMWDDEWYFGHERHVTRHRTHLLHHACYPLQIVSDRWLSEARDLKCAVVALVVEPPQKPIRIRSTQSPVVVPIIVAVVHRRRSLSQW